MKKFLLFISAFVCLQVSAQLLNGDFEDWTTTNILSLDGFQSSQQDNLDVTTITQVTGRSGSGFAVKMETQMTVGVDTTFAYIANFEDEPSSGKGGSPYTQRPDSFVVWANYDVQPNDTAIIMVFLKLGGAVYSPNMYNITGSSSGLWERLSFPIAQPPVVAPDSVIIAFSSSNAINELGIAGGSMLMVDDMSFTSTLPVTLNPIENGNFDAWTTKSYDTPDEWISAQDGSNIQLDAMGAGNPIEKTTDAYEGSSALKFNVVGVPAYDWTYDYFANIYDNGVTRVGGFDYNEAYGDLTGYYKFSTSVSDSMQVFLVLRKGGFSYYSQLSLPPVAAYTKFTLPFDITGIGVPDSAWIEVRGSVFPYPFNTGAIGNVFYLDDLEMNKLSALKVNSTVNLCSSTTADLTDGTSSLVGGTITYYTDALLTSPVVDETAVSAGTYYVLLEKVSGYRDTASISVTVNPKPTVITNAPTVVCSPNTIDLTASAVTAGSTSALTYTYWLNAAATLPLATPSAAPMSGTYYIVGETALGCSDTTAVLVTVNSKPTVITTGPAAVCSPNTVDLTASAVTAGSTASLMYTYFTNSTATTALLSPSAVSSSGTYYIVGETALGCSDTATVATTINPLPTATISGTTAVCKSSTAPEVTFTGANGIAPYTFTYKINGSSFTVSTVSGNSVTVSQSTAIPYVYTYELVSVQDASSTACSNPQTGTVTITVNQLPSATISGTTAVCENSIAPDITFAGIDGVAPYTFTYSINSGTSQTITTATGSSVTVEQSTSTPDDYIYELVSVQDASSTTCSNTQTGSATITVNPKPTVVVTNPPAVEEPSMVDITAAAVTAGSTSGLLYTYWLDAAATSVLSTPFIVSSSGTYYIKGHTLAGCSDTTAVTVTINPTVGVSLNDASPISIYAVESNVVIELMGESAVYEVFDLNGSVVLSGVTNTRKTTIPVSIKGIYLVKVTIDNFIFVDKILVY